MRNLFAALFLLLALVMAHGADAAVRDGTKISRASLKPLADWVQEVTDVSIKAIPITTASDARLQVALNLKGVQQACAAAAYLPGQIVVSNAIWDPESVRMRSYLVHELVHHAQLLSREKYPCSAAKERQAYMLQNLWLIEQGEEPIVSDEWIEKISTCPGDEETEDN